MILPYLCKVKMDDIVNLTKIVSEYDQKIPRQTRGIVRKSHTTITRHQEDKQRKATSSLFPIEMIAKLEWTQRDLLVLLHGAISLPEATSCDKL